MLIKQIDIVGTQAPKRSFDHHTNALGVAVCTLGHFAVLESELGGDHHLVTH